MDLTNNIVEANIEIRKKHKTKLPDAIIAATALVYGLALISRNTSDFKNMDGLNVIDALQNFDKYKCYAIRIPDRIRTSLL